MCIDTALTSARSARACVFFVRVASALSPSPSKRYFAPLPGCCRRSGARKQDSNGVMMTPDDWSRQSANVLRFGTQRASFFAEAEAYQVVPRELRPLNARTRTCAQGRTGTAAWACSAVATQHVACGHAGTLAWRSPTYEVCCWAGYCTVCAWLPAFFDDPRPSPSSLPLRRSQPICAHV